MTGFVATANGGHKAVRYPGQEPNSTCVTPITKKAPPKRGPISGNGLLRRGFLTPALLDLLLNPLFNIGRNPRCHLGRFDVDGFRKLLLSDQLVYGAPTNPGQRLVIVSKK